MQIDEQATFRSVMKALADSNVSVVAKQIDGISKDPLAAALNLAGYRYSKVKPKGWSFVGEGEEPLDKSIFEYVKKSSAIKKTISQRIPNEGTTDAQPIHMQFTQGEVLVIKKMLKSWEEVAPSVVAEQRLSLHERIKQLPREEKVRKTIVIDDTIGDRFDEFCERERLNKSDILHLALLDLLDTYE